MAARAKGPILKALELELKALNDPKVASSTLAASAIKLASTLDHGLLTGAELASVQRALRATMDRLHELDAQAPPADRVDELAQQRQRRRAKAPAKPRRARPAKT